ncbi:polyprenyl synthetase family protein [Salipaludibacillus sp. CUR1]|uniref:polyprenyl synthetase family protein n=1 Tax=Salipaludibacillus sp. CUR1 TaxID=2820003 RepID=UPI001E6214A1|nr:farnesyl diphosphate synthase [Salipaludibacillus sp. CUR1]MCE7794334.1 polyprenyl synthetase family protein [Salipaludibacillus sp. CUR1]
MHQFIQNEKQEIDKRLISFIEQLNAPASLKEAMIYSLEAGGKRIRPVLLLATMHGFGNVSESGYKVACAIEMIHTYSLIHDDLPAMDDDDMRRGKPTNHKIFGEALAILAGDGLLTHSFKVVADLKDVDYKEKIKLVSIISEAAGPSGMVGGQVEDMEAEGEELELEQLQQIHHRKTGDLLALSLECGAILSNATDKEVEELKFFGKHLGLAFQIKDDLLDVEGDEEKIGKPTGSDETNDKNTYPKILGLNQAKEKLAYHLDKAKSHLEQVNMDKTILKELADYIGTRSN